MFLLHFLLLSIFNYFQKSSLKHILYGCSKKKILLNYAFVYSPDKVRSVGVGDFDMCLRSATKMIWNSHRRCKNLRKGTFYKNYWKPLEIYSKICLLKRLKTKEAGKEKYLSHLSYGIVHRVEPFLLLRLFNESTNAMFVIHV